MIEPFGSATLKVIKLKKQQPLVGKGFGDFRIPFTSALKIMYYWAP